MSSVPPTPDLALQPYLTAARNHLAGRRRMQRRDRTRFISKASPNLRLQPLLACNSLPVRLPPAHCSCCRACCCADYYTDCSGDAETSLRIFLNVFSHLPRRELLFPDPTSGVDCIVVCHLCPTCLGKGAPSCSQTHYQPRLLAIAFPHAIQRGGVHFLRPISGPSSYLLRLDSLAEGQPRDCSPSETGTLWRKLTTCSSSHLINWRRVCMRRA